MLLVSWLVLAVVAAVVVARMFAQRYSTTSPRSGKVLRTFRGGKGPAGSAPHKPSLSVVIPCYNEAARLPGMLQDAVAYIRSLRTLAPEDRPFRDVELIVVDDCSTDDTKAVAQTLLTAENLKHSAEDETVLFSIVPVQPNHGKGFAVRSGFFAASGDLVLMADGDNATQFSDVAMLAAQLASNGVDIVVGSRAHLEKDSMASRTLGRTVLMKLFHLVVDVTYFVCTLGRRCRVRDTQCGFKLFRRLASEKLFLNNRLERWAFDVELFILAAHFRMPVVEVPVTWQEVPGSKVRLSGMAQMGLECVLMCFAYPFRLWTIMEAPSLIH